jgi:hypothetical protein
MASMRAMVCSQAAMVLDFRCIDHGDPFLGGFRHIDSINAYAGPADDFQVLRRIDNLCGDLRLASGDDGIVVADDFAQFLFIHIRLDVYNKFLFQDFLGFFGYIGGNKDSEHIGFLLVR